MKGFFLNKFLNPVGGRGGVDWSSYWTTQTRTFNMVIEGHSFVAQASYFEDYIVEKVTTNGFHNVAVGGSLVSDCETRAAITDSYLVSEASGLRNILILWIGVNSFVNDVGIGATRYAEVESYVLDRVAAGWKVFVYTMTPSTSGGRGAQFEFERDIFNGLLRTGIGTNERVFILDTDTISEFDDPSDTVYYLDQIHLTPYGYYLATGLFEDMIQSECPNYTVPAMTTSPAASLTVTPQGTKTAAVRFTVQSADEVVWLALDGDAKFYIDAACTQGERSLLGIAPGDYLKTLYIKCPTDARTLRINNGSLNYFDWYDSGNNGAAPGGDISGVTELTYLIVQTNTTLSGDISAWTKLVYMNLRGTNTLSGSVALNTACIHLENTSTTNALSGSVAGMTSLNFLDVRGNTTISGSVAALTSLTRMYVLGTNTLSGSVAALVNLDYFEVQGNNTLSGSVAALVKLTRLVCHGLNTLTGSLDALTLLTYITIYGNNTVSGDIGASKVCEGLINCSLVPCGITTYTGGGTWGNCSVTISPAAGYGLDQTEQSALLIDLDGGPQSGRTFTLQGSNVSMADTNQGGIWGDFDGETSPSALATAYKNLRRVKTCTINLNGVASPGATGDGTGFPAGFGDWYRS